MVYQGHGWPEYGPVTRLPSRGPGAKREMSPRAPRPGRLRLSRRETIRPMYPRGPVSVEENTRWLSGCGGADLA